MTTLAKAINSAISSNGSKQNLSFLGIGEALKSDVAANRALQAVGIYVKFLEFANGFYCTSSAPGEALGIKGGVVANYVSSNRQVFNRAGMKTITERSEMEAYVKATGSNVLFGAFTMHGAIHLFNPRVVLLLAVCTKGTKQDAVRKYFHQAPYNRKGMKALLESLVESVYGIQRAVPAVPKPVSDIVSLNGNAVAPAPTPPACKPELKGSTGIIYTDASVKTNAGKSGMTVMAAYSPDASMGVIRVYRGILPVEVAELQAMNLGVLTFGKSVLVKTDSQNNVRLWDRVKAERFASMDETHWSYGGFKVLQEAGVDLMFIPREENGYADYLTKFPAITANEGTFKFSIRRVRDDEQGNWLELTPLRESPTQKPIEQAKQSSRHPSCQSPKDALLAVVVQMAEEEAEADGKVQALMEQVNQAQQERRDIGNRIAALNDAINHAFPEKENSNNAK